MLVQYVHLKQTSAACGTGLERQQQGKIFTIGGFHGKVAWDKNICGNCKQMGCPEGQGSGKRKTNFAEKNVWARCMWMNRWEWVWSAKIFGSYINDHQKVATIEAASNSQDKMTWSIDSSYSVTGHPRISMTGTLTEWTLHVNSMDPHLLRLIWLLPPLKVQPACKRDQCNTVTWGDHAATWWWQDDHFKPFLPGRASGLLS